MTTRFFPHWERLDRVSQATGVDNRTILWRNPFLPTETLPYLPPNGYEVTYPASSLDPIFSPVPSDLQAYVDRLA